MLSAKKWQESTKQLTYWLGHSCTQIHSLNVFFRWIASFKIDFWKEIDPWCCYNPRMLACDETHIGVLVKNMLLDPAVTKHDDKDTTLKSVHKRNNRLILRDKSHQKHMHYLASKFLKKLKPSEILHAEAEEEKTAQVLNCAHQNCFNAFYELLVFSHNLKKKDILHIIAWLLLMFFQWFFYVFSCTFPITWPAIINVW